MTELLTDPENPKTVAELKQALDSLILAGQIMEAYDTFYAGNVDAREHGRADPPQGAEPPCGNRHTVKWRPIGFTGIALTIRTTRERRALRLT